MPTYTLLGASGSTGSAILRYLLSSPTEGLKLNILVRNKPKLLKAFPRLEETTTPTIRITEGSSTDVTGLHHVLSSTDVLFMCVGDNESKPGVSLVYDSVAAIISTLQTLRDSEGSQYRIPTVIQVRSASLNPNLSKQAPWLVLQIVEFCQHYEYKDVVHACDLYASSAQEGLLTYIFVDPPALHDPLGTERTGHKLISVEKQSISINYADLGAAMCEVAERRTEFLGKGVGVSATGKVRQTWGTLIWYLVLGVKHRLWEWLPAL